MPPGAAMAPGARGALVGLPAHFTRISASLPVISDNQPRQLLARPPPQFVLPRRGSPAMAHAGDFEDAPLLLHAEAVGPPSSGPAAAAAAPPAAEQALWASGAKTEPINALRVEARSGSAAAALHAAATGMPWGVTAGEGGPLGTAVRCLCRFSRI